MRIDPDAIEASRPDDREIALLAAEVRRLQAVINSEEPTLTDEEREAIKTAIEWSPLYEHPAAVTLRALLDRLK